MISGSLKSDMKARPILIAFAAIWVLEAGMNALYGYRRAGGGFNLAAIGYASAFLAIAFIAAWLPTQMPPMRDGSAVAWIKRMIFVPLTILCIALSQVAGWSVMGVTLADGAAQREDKALSRQAMRDEIERAQRDLRAITETGTADQLARAAKDRRDQAEREGGRVRCGPLCERLTTEAIALEERLGQARRRDELNALIEQRTAQLRAAPAVAAGSPDVDVLARISGATPEDVKFWFVVVLVGIIGLFANLGFAIANIGRGNVPRGEPEDDGGWDWQGHMPQAQLPPMPQRPLLQAPGRPAQPHPAAPASPPAAAGAPIHINFGALPPQQSATDAPARAEAPHLASPVPGHPPLSQPQRALPNPGNPVQSDRPSDREALMRMADDLVVFKAGALIDQEGGVVSEQDVWRRYQQFAGKRAMDRAAFTSMFEVCTGVRRVMFGGVPHYHGVALRSAPQLAAVH